jgi:EmrB/QacA subfamily drug resistance transporter
LGTSSLPSQEYSPTQGRQVLLVTILASSMAFIDGSALNVVLPVLQADFNATGAELLWIVNAYLLMLAALILIGGSLGDLFGRRRIFAAGIGLFMLSSLACGIAPNTFLLIVARVIQGIGGAMMIPGSLAILSAYFPDNLRGRAIGTWSAATTLVFIMGPILGGILGDLGLWRAVFLINIPIGIVCLVILKKSVPESYNDSVPRVLDIPGAVLVALGLAGVTWGLLSAPDLGLANSSVLVSLIGGGLALGFFVIVQMRSRHPMMPLTLFRSRTFTGANLLTLFLYGALTVAMLFLSLNLVQTQAYNPSIAGLAITPFALLLTALSRWAGGLVDRIGPRLPLIIGPFIAGLGFFLMALPGQTTGPDQYWTTFFPGIAFFGIGMGVTVAPLTTTVMSSLPVQFSGTASGINNAVSRIAGVLAIAVLGSVALSAFRTDLTNRALVLNLDQTHYQILMADAARLGDTQVPGGISGEQAQSLQNAINLSFIGSYRLVLFTCAALAWVSALMSAFFISGKIKRTEEAIATLPGNPAD